jgi:hypothetical protein
MKKQSNEVKVYYRSSKIWPWGVLVPSIYRGQTATGPLVCGSEEEAKMTKRRIENSIK